MRNFRIWTGFVAAFSAAALVACGGGGSSSGDPANVRLINATLTHASLSMLANAAPAVPGTAVDTVSAYVGVPSGSPALQVNDATSAAVLATIAPTVGKGQHFALIAYESGGVVRTAVIAEDTAAPTTGTAVLRIFNAATDTGAIDVYVTDPAVDITTLSSPTFTFASLTSGQASASFAPGTYRVRVTGSGNPTDLRLDIASVVLANQNIATVILTPTTGGTLANGAVLLQQGTYTATRNTSARVRLAAAVSGNASVTAAAGGISIGTGVVAPAIGAYTNVAAGSAINVSVNGASIGAPAATLAAGSDSTLLVYGNAGSATATLIADDNHLPSVATNFKLRILNGFTGAAAPLSLDVNFAVLASNVTPGTASGYSVVPAGTAGTLTQIDVTSAASLTPVYTTNAPIPGNSVFTLFMLGDASAVPKIGLLRKDR